MTFGKLVLNGAVDGCFEVWVKMSTVDVSWTGCWETGLTFHLKLKTKSLNKQNRKTANEKLGNKKVKCFRFLYVLFLIIFLFCCIFPFMLHVLLLDDRAALQGAQFNIQSFLLWSHAVELCAKCGLALSCWSKHSPSKNFIYIIWIAVIAVLWPSEMYVSRMLCVPYTRVTLRMLIFEQQTDNKLE